MAAAVAPWTAVAVVAAAEDGDLVAALHQAGAELLDVVLDATKGRRETLLTDHRDP